jgi:hypothetical protein
VNIVISQPMFFPWPGIFEQIRLSDVYVHYSDVQFSKGSFANRVQIKTPNGIAWMTVPLSKHKLGQAICDTRISYEKDWRRKHRKLLERAYETAPFRNEMMTIVDSVYSEKHTTLDEISKASIAAVCYYLGLEQSCRFIDIRDLEVGGNTSQRVLDTVLALGGDTYTTGHGAKNYLDHDLFEAANVTVSYMDYRKTPYPQLHGEFTPYVSVLDLIANTGDQSSDFINSETVYWKEFLHRE